MCYVCLTAALYVVTELIPLLYCFVVENVDIFCLLPLRRKQIAEEEQRSWEMLGKESKKEAKVRSTVWRG